MGLWEQLCQSLLVPPGEGVYTVHTARKQREAYQAACYGGQDVRKSWENSLAHIPHEIIVLGIPSDCGGGIQRGANWGPLAIREALLKENYRQFLDIGDVKVIPHLLHDKYINQETLEQCRKALYGSAEVTLPVSPLSIAELVAQSFYQAHPKKKIFTLGGDHSTSYPVTKAWAQSRGHQDIGMIHFDAHTDLLDSRLGIDLCFGSWTYHAREFFAYPDHIVQLGIRSSGKERSHWENNLGVKQLWANHINSRPVEEIIAEISTHLKKKNITELYVSFDIDALDSRYAPATGTPEPAGLTPDTCAVILQSLATDFIISGADLMEVAPHVSWEERTSTTSAMQTVGQMARQLLECMR